MPPGNNKGNQLNIFMFEVGILRRDPLGIVPDITFPLVIQPILTLPTRISYTDMARGGVQETTGGAIRNIAGRANQTVQMSGNWGVQVRGLGPFLGTGELDTNVFCTRWSA